MCNKYRCKAGNTFICNGSKIFENWQSNKDFKFRLKNMMITSLECEQTCFAFISEPSKNMFKKMHQVKALQKTGFELDCVLSESLSCVS